MANDIVSTIAEGLDESVGGEGWGAKHQVAAGYANASPLLLAACRAALDCVPKGSVAQDLCMAAILAAEGAEELPHWVRPKADLELLIDETLHAETVDLEDRPAHYVEARVTASKLAATRLAEFR